MAKKFFIETFGCQMNELDSEKIAGHLRQDGLEAASEPSEADLIVLNTCSVRAKAVQRVYARLGELKRRKTERPALLLGVVGCMAQLEGKDLPARAPFVDLIAGPQKGHLLPEMMRRRLESGRPAIDLRLTDDPEPLETTEVLRESRWRAAVTISEGCSRLCSFCVVPFTRGKQRDRNSESIIREVEGLVSDGYLEITLLGQSVTSYRDPSDRHPTFAGLLRRLADVNGLRRIRFTAPYPSDFSRELLDVMVSCPNVCNHIHLPVQSGSTRILREMRRGYTRERYLEIVDLIRGAARPIAISTDIIVGFPGESDEDFEGTLSLLDTVQYEGMYSFKYSPRPNTAAFVRQDDVPEGIKAARLAILQQQQKLIQFNINAGYVGRIVTVLPEDAARTQYRLSGRTSNNKVVNFDGPDELLGQLVPIEITGFGPHSLKGTTLRRPPEEE